MIDTLRVTARDLSSARMGVGIRIGLQRIRSMIPPDVQCTPLQVPGIMPGLLEWKDFLTQARVELCFLRLIDLLFS